MIDKEKLTGLIEDAIAGLSYDEGPQGLFAPVRYTLEGGGKRLRPLLLLSTCEALGGDPDTAISLQ